ncbi:proteoglycan 4-like [Culex pipiens pallens]|uniref:proteoglycan 4-like n=1 Tax=Culex pipiens pallens TaxID=42434 RepID=UPI001953F765|nr:proteoglycan 4-like [Culex pipiens pallens]
MGLKLKWFRRRLTFEGIPSAPERSTRRKEHNTGITVIGVYRQSVNYEDYIEPTRSSYSWEPASHPFVTTTIRKPATSVPLASTSAAATTTTTLEKRTASPDKIAAAPKTKKSSTPARETPPQPTYSPPKLPVRKSLTKTKSTPNIATAAASLEPVTLEVTRSVEVLNEGSVPLSRSPAARSTTIVSRNSDTEIYNERSVDVDGDSLGSFGKVKSTTRSPPPEPKSPEAVPEELWKQKQPEFFNEILQKVNGLAAASKSPELDRPTKPKEPALEDDAESFNDIFQKVKARPRNPADGQESPKPEPIVEAFPINRKRSIEDIFEPRKPELVPDVLITTAPQIVDPNPSPKPIKSILKKRAPGPPPTSPQPAPPTVTMEIPTPPPRSIRKEEPIPIKRTVSEDSDDDDYDTWNMVERHRSSISQTAARVDPEVVRNVPTSLQLPRQSVPSEPPRTLRGMRDYHHKQQQPNASSSDGGDGLFLGRHARGARDSESTLSEASA